MKKKSCNSDQRRRHLIPRFPAGTLDLRACKPVGNFRFHDEFTPDQSKVHDPTTGNPITVKFSGRAGEVLPMNLKRMMGYAGYSHALGVEGDAINEWAPFSTRMEWELARWAKTRGPSSTAQLPCMSFQIYLFFTMQYEYVYLFVDMPLHTPLHSIFALIS